MSSVTERLDELVDDYCRNVRYFKEPLTPARARMYITQTRLTTRQRNGVLKMRVATNCPIWDVKLEIVGAVTQEIIADDKYARGQPHWKVVEDLGVAIGMDRDEIQAAGPTPTTQMCWLAWDSLMSNRHWLEGIVANTCTERAVLPGFGEGDVRKYGTEGAEARRWKKLFGLSDEQLEFFIMHEEADKEHGDIGWNAVAEYAAGFSMEDAVVDACRLNLMVWEMYENGIGDEADKLEREQGEMQERAQA